jgi:glycosyltransferase involved in cell wall biosynthesis
VLVRTGSEVVEWHCSRCDGGRSFGTSEELEKLLGTLLADPKAANRMGARGHAYVMENYQWPQVLDRIEADLESLGRPWDRPLHSEC